MSKREDYIKKCRDLVRAAIASVPDFANEFAVEVAINDARKTFGLEAKGAEFETWQDVVREEMDREKVPQQKAQSRTKPIAGQLPLLCDDFEHDGGDGGSP